MTVCVWDKSWTLFNFTGLPDCRRAVLRCIVLIEETLFRGFSAASGLHVQLPPFLAFYSMHSHDFLPHLTLMSRVLRPDSIFHPHRTHEAWDNVTVHWRNSLCPVGPISIFMVHRLCFPVFSTASVHLTGSLHLAENLANRSSQEVVRDRRKTKGRGEIEAGMLQGCTKPTGCM